MTQCIFATRTPPQVLTELDQLDVDHGEQSELHIKLPDGLYDTDKPIDKLISALHNLRESGSFTQFLRNHLFFLEGVCS